MTEYRLSWETVSLTEDEKLQVSHARMFALGFSHARIPGSSQFTLIAKLAELLDVASAQLPNAETQEPIATETDEELERKFSFGYTGPSPRKVSDYIKHSDDVVRKPFVPNRDA